MRISQNNQDFGYFIPPFFFPDNSGVRASILAPQRIRGNQSHHPLTGVPIKGRANLGMNKPKQTEEAHCYFTGFPYKILTNMVQADEIICPRIINLP